MQHLMIHNLNNIHIINSEELLTPEELKVRIPLTNLAARNVWNTRLTINSILSGGDPRKIIVVGPCSIHDINLAEDYARRLAVLAEEVKDKFVVVMRTYFEKPRTTVGWKGFINYPNLDDSFDVAKGLTLGRTLLMYIAELGLPIATEVLDPIIPQYISELIGWAAIGARTTESQTHRELASGLSMAVGFKNGTDGNIDIAVNAMLSAQSSHRFLGINQHGKASVFRTTGNSNIHLILRGGKNVPNYDRSNVAQATQALLSNNLPARIVVDCSHGNSSKDYRKQIEVFEDLIDQIKEGNQAIKGMMLESNINEGNQKITPSLTYGVSITDSCIGFAETQHLILKAYQNLS